MIQMTNAYAATNLLSSANSVNPGIGQRPGRVRQMFAERRLTNDGGGVGTSPVGWDKSYPLKPVNLSTTPNAPIYRRNTNAAATVNKYSGNYGPKRSSSTNRGVSLDRGAR